MKSPQLVRLQQQFLKSLHSKPSKWLLNEIEPAQGFGTAELVLDTYLSRAISRTVDPLKQIYQHVRWLLGDRAFESLISDFYAESLGEPLSSIELSGVFAAFIENNFSQQYISLIKFPFCSGDQSPISLRPIVIGLAMLDWRLNWCELAPKRTSSSREVLLHELNHRRHLWARPRLERGSRVFNSLVDFDSLLQADISQPRTGCIDLHEIPKPYLIYLSPAGKVKTIQLGDALFRILSRCDGTHTLTSIFYEEMLFGVSKQQSVEHVRELIGERIIVQFQYELTTP